MDLLVVDWIFFFVCLFQVWLGKSLVSWDLGLEMVFVFVLVFFFCCFIKSLRRYNFVVWQIFCMVVVNFWFGLQCGLGWNLRLIGQDCLLMCFFRIDRYFRFLVFLFFIEEMLFLSWRKFFLVLGYLGVRIFGRMVCFFFMCLSLFV